MSKMRADSAAILDRDRRTFVANITACGRERLLRVNKTKARTEVETNIRVWRSPSPQALRL